MNLPNFYIEASNIFVFDNNDYELCYWDSDVVIFDTGVSNSFKYVTNLIQLRSYMLIYV